MTRIIIIDDEKEARTNVQKLLNAYCEDFEILGMASGVQAGVEMINVHKPDAIFCDIEMRDGTGFDLLDQFENPNFQIIFVTAYDDYAIKAFRYNAIDYLLKPINPKELQEAFKKIQSSTSIQTTNQIENLKASIRNNEFNMISLSNEDGLHYVEVADIIRLEGFKNYTTFHLLKGKPILISKNLGYYIKLLDSLIFFRCHQSHAVNLYRVKRLSKAGSLQVEMNNGDQVPISRRRKDELEKALNELHNI